MVANIVPLERRNHPPPPKPHTVRRCQAWGIARLLLARSKKTNHQHRWWERQCDDAILSRSVKPECAPPCEGRAACNGVWTIRGILFPRTIMFIHSVRPTTLLLDDYYWVDIQGTPGRASRPSTASVISEVLWQHLPSSSSAGGAVCILSIVSE